jgi:hypothetical protein
MAARIPNNSVITTTQLANGVMNPETKPTSPIGSDDMQKALLDFLRRRHPEYEVMLPVWNFAEETYNGGREWFRAGNIFRYIKEGDTEFGDRLDRCYRFNHTREVTDLVQKYIFKSPITRNDTDAPPEVQAFWEQATLSGLDINQFMKTASTSSSIFGRPWIFVDSSKDAEVITKKDEKTAEARVYAYLVKPQDILDVGFSQRGEVNWVLVRETLRDDDDPIFSSGELFERYRLWEKNTWTLFEIVAETPSAGKGKPKIQVEIVDEAVHGLGEVPGFPADHTVGDYRYSSPALISDIAYLDRAVANYLSNLDAIIQDQTFSQLAMPAQSVLPGEDAYDALIEMGSKRVFLYDGEGGAKPEYLSPDPRQAKLILDVINKIIIEIYHTIGMAGERTNTDNAVGADNASGVAKAYDFERMNSLLTSKADSLENSENRIIRLVMAWHGKKAPKEELVKYPDTFDVRSLYDEIAMAEKLMLVAAPDGVRREQMTQVIDKLFPRLARDLKQKLEAELKTWPPEPVVDETTGKALPAPGGAAAKPKNAKTANRQGQNNTG